MTEEERKRLVRITDIQHFCLDDGPGIRTTVFFKGCKLRCPWCCNPETQEYKIQEYTDKETGDTKSFGYDITLEELESELLNDKEFYIAEGGITLSGGEPLLQIETYVPLLESLSKKGINISVETSLFIDNSILNKAINYIDLFLIDMKIVDYDICKSVLRGDINCYLNNLNDVIRSGKKYLIRMPCIKDYTATKKNISKIIDLCKEKGIKEIQLLTGHSLGLAKYLLLNRESVNAEISSSDMRHIRNEFGNSDIRAEILKI